MAKKLAEPLDLPIEEGGDGFDRDIAWREPRPARSHDDRDFRLSQRALDRAADFGDLIRHDFASDDAMPRGHDPFGEVSSREVVDRGAGVGDRNRREAERARCATAMFFGAQIDLVFGLTSP